MREYSNSRWRGFHPGWQPQAKTVRLLDQVKEILDEYADYLPLTLRQIFYRLVGAHGYPKDERAYARLGEALNKARRAVRIPFEAIRDDGQIDSAPLGFSGLAVFRRWQRSLCKEYRRDRLEGQPLAIELWIEAAGMVPQLERVAFPYGVPIYSSGGFDSLTVKHEAAQRFAARTRPTAVLQVGDFDASGLSIFDSAAADITAMLDVLGGEAEFHRIVIAEDQIGRYQLPTAPPKPGDRRGGWQAETVQAEALAPDELAAEVEAALLSVIDLNVWQDIVTTEETERAELEEWMDDGMEA